MFHRRGFLKAAGSGVILSSVVSQPAAQNQAEGPTVYVGSNDGSVYAVEVETGEGIWMFEGPDDVVRSDPIVVGGTLYVTSRDNNLYAIDATDGTEQWQFDLGRGAGDASPTVVNNTVYIAGSPFDSSVYAINADSGDQKWVATAPNAGVDEAPAVANGRVFVGSRDENIYALDADSGEEVWRFEGPTAQVRASPTHHDGVVYVAAGVDIGQPIGERDHDDTLYAINAETGNEVWQFSTAGRADLAPTVADGTVYVGTVEVYESDDEWESRGTLHAIDTESGEEEWHYLDPESSVSAAPTVADGTICVGTQGLVALDSETGEKEWQVGDPAAARSAPTAHNGVVYAGMDDSSLYAIDIASGEIEWIYEEPSDFVVSAPTVVLDPANGHSAGSRAILRTLSHHDRESDTEPEPTVDTTFTIDNVGTSAWELTDIDGDDVTAPIGEENPTIKLEEGARYRIENEGGSAHPLAFERADGTVLLSQDSEGSLESDESVKWVGEDDRVEFTLTESLASELSTYVCTIHGSMEGSIETDIDEPEDPDEVPEEHESGVDQDVFDAVDQSGDGDVSLGDLQTAVDDWSSNQQINDVDASLDDLRAIVEWWAS